MTTHERQVATYNEIEAIYERNNPSKERKRADELVKLTGELIKKRLLEIASNDKLLVAYMKQINGLGLEPQPTESSASYLMRMRDPGNYTWVQNFCEENSIQKPEEFLRLANEHMRCQLTYYCEICESPDLSEKIKIERGNYILQIYQNMLDLGGIEFTPEIEKMLAVIRRRVADLRQLKSGNDLYYWPVKTLSFDNVMEKLKEETLIPDTSLAKEVFKDFDNHGLTLRWNGSKRQLMYFLLLLFDTGLNNESIPEIAFKLFDFKGKFGKNARRSFATDLSEIKNLLPGLPTHQVGYRPIYHMMRSLT